MWIMAIGIGRGSDMNRLLRVIQLLERSILLFAMYGTP